MSKNFSPAIPTLKYILKLDDLCPFDFLYKRNASVMKICLHVLVSYTLTLQLSKSSELYTYPLVLQALQPRTIVVRKNRPAKAPRIVARVLSCSTTGAGVAQSLPCPWLPCPLGLLGVVRLWVVTGLVTEPGHPGTECANNKYNTEVRIRRKLLSLWYLSHFLSLEFEDSSYLCDISLSFSLLCTIFWF